MNSIPTIPPVYSAANTSRGCKTILVVDDFAPLCDWVADHLTKIGYRVMTANDPVEAHRMIRSDAGSVIDLLLTDLNMPGMRGDKLAAWCLCERPRIRAVLMSSSQYHPGVPGTGCIQKPFSLAQLERVVREALGDNGFSEEKVVKMRPRDEQMDRAHTVYGNAALVA